MSMTDCAVVTDEEEEEDMLMLDGCWLVALRGLCVRFKWAIMSVRDGLLFETTGVECVDLSTHAKMKMTRPAQQQTTDDEQPPERFLICHNRLPIPRCMEINLPTNEQYEEF